MMKYLNKNSFVELKTVMLAGCEGSQKCLTDSREPINSLYCLVSAGGAVPTITPQLRNTWSDTRKIEDTMITTIFPRTKQKVFSSHGPGDMSFMFLINCVQLLSRWCKNNSQRLAVDSNCPKVKPERWSVRNFRIFWYENCWFALLQ